MNAEFRYGDERKKEPYRYTMCGLDDIYLVGGYELTRTRYGDGVVIHDMEDLHRAIGEYLVESKKALTGKEIRFLRHEMDLTQAEIAGLLRVADQTVARWEKGECEIPGPADMVVRALYLGHIGEEFNIRELAEYLRAMDAPAGPERQVFESTESGWQPLPEAA